MSEDVFAPLEKRGITAVQLKKAIYEVLAAIGPTEALCYLLTVSELAALLSIHEDTVRKYLREGKIRGFKLEGDREWRVRPVDYIDFLEKKVLSLDERILELLRERKERTMEPSNLALVS